MSAPLDRDKLARVLGMLGSSHDGEVLAAARQAERIRREAGAAWAQILAPPPAIPCWATIEPPKSLAEAIDLCLDHQDRLTSWERGFIGLIAHQSYDLTPKQDAVVRRLCVAEMTI